MKTLVNKGKHSITKSLVIAKKPNKLIPDNGILNAFPIYEFSVHVVQT